MAILGIIFLLLHFIVSVEFNVYLWGFDTWSALPSFISMLLLLLGVLSFVPTIQEKLETPLKKLFNILCKIPLFVYPFIAGGFFYLFRQKGYFLGDGNLRIREAEKGIYFSASEPLDTYIHSYLYKFLHSALDVSGADIYAGVSILCGIITVIITAFYLRKLFKDKSERFFIAALIFTTGSIQLFFGYVESYSTASCIIICYLFSAFSMIQEKRAVALPAILFLFAIAFHTSSLLLFPSLVYAYYITIYKSSSRRIKIIWYKPPFLLIPLLILIYIFIGIFVGGSSLIHLFDSSLKGDLLLPFISNKDIYGIFSMNHFIDVFNELALITPALLALPLIVRKFKRDYFDRFIIFFLLIIVCYLFYMFIFNPTLGYARDWDLFAAAGFPLSFALGLFILKMNPKKLYNIAFPLFIVSILHTIPWLIMNSDENSTLTKAQALAETPYWTSRSRSLLYDELSYYYSKKNLLDSSLKYNALAYKYERNDRYLFRSGSLSFELGKKDEALKYFSELTKGNFQLALVYNYLGDIYFEKKMYVEAKENYLKALEKNNKNTNALTNLGVIYSETYNFQKAVEYLLKSKEIIPDDKFVNFYLAVCYANMNEYAQSLKFLDLALKYGYDERTINSLRHVVEQKKIGNIK